MKTTVTLELSNSVNGIDADWLEEVTVEFNYRSNSHDGLDIQAIWQFAPHGKVDLNGLLSDANDAKVFEACWKAHQQHQQVLVEARVDRDQWDMRDYNDQEQWR